VGRGPHTLKLADVWRDESYVSTGLPRKAPEFPLVDPLDPNVVIDRREGQVFDVDLSTRKVKSCDGGYKGLNDMLDHLNVAVLAASDMGQTLLVLASD
jgi:hypothetical protein